MEIEIERSGGFAGIKKIVKIDTESLPTKMAQDIENYISKANSMSSNLIAKRIKAPDSFVYKIAIKGGVEKREMEINELDASKKLKMAINYVFKNFA